jgi:predicted RNase H-like nuclease (RuvC/YqgF family)
VERQDWRETGDVPQPDGEAISGTTETGGSEIPDQEELMARLGIKDNRIRELYEEITAYRLAADEARASKEAGEEHIEALERECANLKERIRDLQEETRDRSRRRESSGRQIARLERELVRKEGEISHRDYLLERQTEQMEAASQRAEELASRKDLALQDALRRVDGLERDLEEREEEISELNMTIEVLRGDLEAEQELRGRLADPANRLRAGIELFNESSQRNSMNSLSRTMGQPEVHVELDVGEEPPALLTFTWQGVTWQTYVSDPGPGVEEPRVYLKSAGENLSGVDRKPPNARVGSGDRVMLGL